MPRSDNTKSLPPKAKLRDEIDYNESLSTEQSGIEGNHFSDVQYHNKSWLFGFFGKKDGTSDARYYGLKSEISAFASECYRMYTNGHSPKYRPVYARQRALVLGTYSPHYQLLDDHVSVGFITEKVNQPITLSQVFDFLDHLDADGNLFWSPTISDYLGRSNIEEYCAKTKDSITDWCEYSINRINEKFAESKGVMQEDDYLVLKNMLVSFLSNLKEKFLEELANEQLQSNHEGSFSAEKICKKINSMYKQNKYEFYQSKISPIKLNLITKFAEYLLRDGLPEIMAMGYALGEWSFKARDIIFDTTNYHVFKIDHERCLWEISHALLIDLKATHVYSASPEDISNQQSISSQDIDEFPKRINTPRFWPSSKDAEKYPQWFLDLFDREEFKQRAYVTLLAFSLTPDTTISSLGKQFFKPCYSEQIIEHVNKRKNNLQKAMKHSINFAKFLATMPDTDIESLFNAHNGRWNKQLKYKEICIDFETVNNHLAELRDYLKRKKDKIDPLVNHTYTIKTPGIKVA